MNKLRRLIRRTGLALSMTALCSSPFAACYFLERDCRSLQWRLDACEANLKDQKMTAGIMQYKIKKICRRLDDFSYQYSPALEVIFGTYLYRRSARLDRFRETAELLAAAFPNEIFDVTRVWHYMIRKGIIQEVKR